MIEYLTMVLAPIIFVLFFRSLFPKEIHKWYLIILFIVSIIESVIVLATPTHFFSFSAPIYELIIFVGIIYLLVAIIKTIIRKRDGAVLFLLGLLAVFIGLVNDILYVNHILRIIELAQFATFIFILIQSFVLSRRFTLTFNENESLNAELEYQNKNLEAIVIERTHEITEQKKEIEDSIQYAKRIQTAVLPAHSYTDTILGDHFIIFKPKDVVSGDFYYATKLNNYLVITVADCTGHGVPGAFMSMLGISFLNEIARKRGISQASQALDFLRRSVIEALKQTGGMEEQKDGLDMSLVVIHEPTGKMQYSGANNPLWMIRNIDLIKIGHLEDSVELISEIKADKQPVSFHVRMEPFTNHEFQVEKGDQIYLFSDGYPDQSGGKKGKKFMYKPFKRLLSENCLLTMPEQGTLIERTLDEWMKGYEQIDDITVVGVRT